MDSNLRTTTPLSQHLERNRWWVIDLSVFLVLTKAIDRYFKVVCVVCCVSRLSCLFNVFVTSFIAAHTTRTLYCQRYPYDRYVCNITWSIIIFFLLLLLFISLLFIEFPFYILLKKSIIILP